MYYIQKNWFEKLYLLFTLNILTFEDWNLKTAVHIEKLEYKYHDRNLR